MRRVTSRKQLQRRSRSPLLKSVAVFPDLVLFALATATPLDRRRRLCGEAPGEGARVQLVLPLPDTAREGRPSRPRLRLDGRPSRRLGRGSRGHSPKATWRSGGCPAVDAGAADGRRGGPDWVHARSGARVFLGRRSGVFGSWEAGGLCRARQEPADGCAGLA